MSPGLGIRLSQLRLCWLTSYLCNLPDALCLSFPICKVGVLTSEVTHSSKE